MEMTLGDPGIDWGNVADWLSVLVNVFVGWSVFWLGRRTYELTQSANRRDDRAHDAQNQQESREGRLLLLLFRSEIGNFRIQLERALGLLDRDAKFVSPHFYGRDFLELINELEIPSVQDKLGRLHILPDEQAVALVSLVGNIMPLRKIAMGAAATVGEGQARADAILRHNIRGLISTAKWVEETCEEARRSFNLPGWVRGDSQVAGTDTTAAQ